MCSSFYLVILATKNSESQSETLRGEDHSVADWGIGNTFVVSLPT